MRLHRLPLALARFLFVVLIGAFATVTGALTALTLTDAGHEVVARALTEQSGRLVRGTIRIARIEGNFWTAIALDSVEVRDSSGALLALFPRVETRYRIVDFFRNRIVLDELHLVRPRIHLIQHRGGRMNFEEVLRLGEGPPGGRGPLVEFRKVSIDDGILTIRTPWSPPGELRTDAQRDSALRAQRRIAGRRIEEGPGREGLEEVRTVEDLAARFSRLRIATPDHAPILVVVDSLAATINSPLVRLADARGEVTTARDTLWFKLSKAALPGTRGTAEGHVAWPQDTLLYSFSFDAAEMALADLRFVSPEFPDYTGRGKVEAYSFNGTESQFDIRDLVMGDSVSRISGSLIALVHRRRGLGFKGLNLAISDMDLDVARAYLDTIPFTGRLSGALRADGYFDGMRVDLDWAFADDRIPGKPVNRLAMNGSVVLGGVEGIVFRQATVTAADLDLPTMRLASSAVILEGRATAAGTLDGPWKDVTFTGSLRHQDGDRPASAASGRIRLNTRDTLVSMDADLEFAPLDFDGIRRAFPTLTSLGQVAGPVRLVGRLDSMELEARLHGDLGTVHAVGLATLLPPRWGAWPLTFTFSDVDLAKLRGTGPPTRLAGRLVMQGAIDSLVAPAGELDLVLGPGWFREVHIDSLAARVAVRDSVVRLDSAVVTWAGGEARANGTLGWARPYDGELNLGMLSSSVATFDSLAMALAGLEPDPTGRRERLDGAFEGHVTLRGALDSLDVRAEGGATAFRFAGFHVPTMKGQLGWRGGPRPLVTVHAGVDSLAVGGLAFTDLSLDLDGPTDSIGWQAHGRSGKMVQGAMRGSLRRGAARVLQVDTLDVQVRENRWQLGRPFTTTLEDSVFTLTPVALGRSDGAASILMEGTVPNRSEGSLDIRVYGFDLRDVYAVLQRDTAQIKGTVLLDLRVGGTAMAPVIRGTGSLTGPVFGDFRAPLVRTALLYEKQRLNANLAFWRTGQPIMDVGAILPLDLAWRGERHGSRQLPGDLAIRARADSMDLAILEAFTRNLRRVRGTLVADVFVNGSWDAPRLGGSLGLVGGRATVPNLGVTYGPIDARVSLRGDSIVVDTLHVAGQRGALDVDGVVRLEELTNAVLDLKARARAFSLMDVPGYLTLQIDGSFNLGGPLVRPVLTGSATVSNSVLYFSDLVSKTIVNLEDPLYADLVDTVAIRQRGLGAAFQSRLLDSLTIRDFRFRAAEGVWLRSNEANIQLEGAVAVDKVRKVYRLDGTFNAPRGTYNLKLGPITRAFDVRRGVVRYLGDADLDADLDIEARHVIKSASADAAARDLEVIAKIGGTLRVPRLTLESTIRPPLSQSDLVSMLILGRPMNQQVATPQQSQAYGTAMALLTGALSSELERALVTGSKAAPDMIEIRPGVGYSSISAGGSLTRLSAGWQVGTRWFVSLNAGFCPGFQQFDFRNFGAGIDYRINRDLVYQASAEPIQTCLAGAASSLSSKRYQFGTDLRWSREY